MLRIKILSPTGLVYEGNVAHVTFPGEIGSFSVYPSHAPIISSLVTGEIVCFPAAGSAGAGSGAGSGASSYGSPSASSAADFGGGIKIAVDSGFAEVRQDVITVCVEQNNINYNGNG
ncbi:MAG: F0F1 ATP synthase subunit epsilon [Tannerella sp.]|jgi:F-type H+-transporting ATPase subunit epsilon|nr:F0F1 ATP synthase subunit epsilon [Tannerella sp.]